MEIGKSMGAAPTSKPLLSLEDLVVQREGQRLCGPLSVQLYPGEVYCVVGKNGSGKSTLLRQLAGLREDSSSLHGRGFCFIGHQDWQSFDLTVLETVTLWAKFYGGDPDKALKAFELSKLSSRVIHQLSQGQKQRLSLARLLCGSFDLWIIDEPFANLDEGFDSVVSKIFQSHAQAGGGLIFSEPKFTRRFFDCRTISLERDL